MPKKTTARATIATPAITLACDLIKVSEGCRLEAYPDPATGGEPWTIGYGATGNDIDATTTWTQTQADDDLQRRVERLIRCIGGLVAVPLNDGQLAALVSFADNLGLGALSSSTLLRLLNHGSYQGAAGQFQRWVYAAGKVLPGLQTRRARERDLFLTGGWE